MVIRSCSALHSLPESVQRLRRPDVDPCRPRTPASRSSLPPRSLTTSGVRSPSGGRTTTAPRSLTKIHVAVGGDRRRVVRAERAREAALLEQRAGLGIERGDDAVVVHHVEDVAVDQRRRQLRHRALVLPPARPCRSCRRCRRGGSRACRSPNRARRGSTPTRPWSSDTVLVRGRRRQNQNAGGVLRKLWLLEHAVLVGVGRRPDLVGRRHDDLACRDRSRSSRSR